MCKGFGVVVYSVKDSVWLVYSVRDGVVGLQFNCFTV